MSTKAPVSFYRPVTITNPAAGAEFIIQPPGGAFWRVVGLAFRLVTDANVADRNVNLSLNDQTDTYTECRSGVDQAASLTGRYSAFPGASPGGFAITLVNIALPEGGALLQPGHRLTSRTVNIQVGDQYSLIRALVQEFPQGPGDEWLPTVDTQIYAMG